MNCVLFTVRHRSGIVQHFMPVCLAGESNQGVKAAGQPATTPSRSSSRCGGARAGHRRGHVPGHTPAPPVMVAAQPAGCQSISPTACDCGACADLFSDKAALCAAADIWETKPSQGCRHQWKGQSDVMVDIHSLHSPHSWVTLCLSMFHSSFCQYLCVSSRAHHPWTWIFANAVK